MKIYTEFLYIIKFSNFHKTLYTQNFLRKQYPDSNFFLTMFCNISYVAIILCRIMPTRLICKLVIATDTYIEHVPGIYIITCMLFFRQQGISELFR